MKLQEYGWEVTDQPWYSPRLAYSNFHLLGTHKKHLAGKQFAPDTGVWQAVTSGHRHLSCRDISLDAIAGKYLNVNDEGRGFLCTSAAHMSCRHWSKNKVLGIIVFVTLHLRQVFRSDVWLTMHRNSVWIRKTN